MRDPIHKDLPDEYREACESLFEYPADERAFICRSWTNKPYADTGLTPACFALNASSLGEAEIVATCIHGVLDYLYRDSMQAAINGPQIMAVIATLRRRCLLLAVEEAEEIFAPIGVPVHYEPEMIEYRNTPLVMPLLALVGFEQRTIDMLCARTPTKW